MRSSRELLSTGVNADAASRERRALGIGAMHCCCCCLVEAPGVQGNGKPGSCSTVGCSAEQSSAGFPSKKCKHSGM